MYESPVNLTFMDEMVDNIVKQQKEQEENYIMEYVRKICIDVDKEELLKALQYDREQYEKGYQDGINADKWIDCKDKLPTEFFTVLVALKNGYVTTARYRLEEFVPEDKFVDRFVEENPVIAWQPLPEAPNR